MSKRERKRLAVLDVLSANDRPLGSSKITDILVAQGMEISERTVRLYLLELDNQGMTENLGRRGAPFRRDLHDGFRPSTDLRHDPARRRNTRNRRRGGGARGYRVAGIREPSAGRHAIAHDAWLRSG